MCLQRVGVHEGLVADELREEILIDDDVELLDEEEVMRQSNDLEEVLAHADEFAFLGVQQQHAVCMQGDGVQQTNDEDRRRSERRAVVLQQGQIEQRAVVDERAWMRGRFEGVQASASFE